MLALLLFAGGISAAPPVEVPKEVAGEVGAFVTVRAKTDGKVVRFVPLDAGLNTFPSDLLADKKATVVTASAPGRYRLLAYSSVKDDPTEPAVVVVVIGGAAPVPDPKPKPDPKPVDPEEPKVDAELLGKFRDALKADVAAGASKAKAADLASVYEEGAALLSLNDPAIAPKTVGDLYAKCFAASVAKDVPRLPYLSNVRGVIDATLGKREGSTEMTPILRAEFGSMFDKVAAALKEASK